MVAALKFNNIIFCEYAVEGLNNKYTLVNVYANDIIVGALPATLSLALYIEHVPDTDKPISIDLEILRDRKLIATINVQAVQQKAGEVGVIMIPRFNLKVERDCTFAVVAKSEGYRPKTILERTISVGEIPTPNALPPPS